jgi:hypothetical protein
MASLKSIVMLAVIAVARVFRGCGKSPLVVILSEAKNPS